MKHKPIQRPHKPVRCPTRRCPKCGGILRNITYEYGTPLETRVMQCTNNDYFELIDALWDVNELAGAIRKVELFDHPGGEI